MRLSFIGAISVSSATTFPGGAHAALLGRRAITIGHTLNALVARQANAAAGAIGVGAALNAHAGYANWSWATTILVVVALHAATRPVTKTAGTGAVDGRIELGWSALDAGCDLTRIPVGRRQIQRVDADRCYQRYAVANATNAIARDTVIRHDGASGLVADHTKAGHAFGVGALGLVVGAVRGDVARAGAVETLKGAFGTARAVDVDLRGGAVLEAGARAARIGGIRRNVVEIGFAAQGGAVANRFATVAR